MSNAQSTNADAEKYSTTRRNQSILLIANGPSTKPLADFGFANLPDTMDYFGMGAAYRCFSRINWWPNFYACCNINVVHSHKHELARLILDPNISVERFFFSLPILSHSRFECVPHSSTSDFCIRKAIEFGYTKIFIIGLEGDFAEELAESRPLTEDEFRDQGFDEVFRDYRNNPNINQKEISLFREHLRVIQKTPKSNPNFFFDDYQLAGDIYTIPALKAQSYASCKKVERKLNSEVQVFNVSPSSKVRDFPKLAWREFLREITQPDSHAARTTMQRPIETPTQLSSSDLAAARSAANVSLDEPLATLIIGYKPSTNDTARLRNLRYLLSWLERIYGNLFEILLVEQGTEQTIATMAKEYKSNARYEFLYNPQAYNRGWGYNAAVRHFTQSRVVALLDTDVLPGANFMQEVIDCHRYYQVATPYLNVYFANDEETSTIFSEHTFEGLCRPDGVKKPTTITGGVVIIRRNLFEEIAGFEQYIEYAGEDRSMDVTLLNHCAPADIRLAPYTYVHLNHPTGNEVRPHWDELFEHLRENYGCIVDPELTAEQSVHMNCQHVSKKKTLANLARRRTSYGDLDLYRSGAPLTINGCYVKPSHSDFAIFPPAFKGLEKYETNEIYKAPKPDSAKISLLHNAYQGKRCFIIGNGPSLNKHDLARLKGEYSFAVNSFFYKTDETGFHPTFYVVEDSSVMNENIERIRCYEAPLKFFPTIYKDLHPHDDNVHFFHMNRGFYEKSSPNYCVPRFSTDATKVVYCGQSVTYINLQLAFFMGFTEVYLIGMDFDYVIPPEHKRNGDLILSTTEDPNHFHKDYFGKGKTWKDPKLERVALNYSQAKLSFESVGRRIYNASIGGKLELFERVDYDALLGGAAGLAAEVRPREPDPGAPAPPAAVDALSRAGAAAPAAGGPALRSLWGRHRLSFFEAASLAGLCSSPPLALVYIESGQRWPWAWAALLSAFAGGVSLAAILRELFRRARASKAYIGDLQKEYTKLAREIAEGKAALAGSMEALRSDFGRSLAATEASMEAAESRTAQAIGAAESRAAEAAGSAVRAAESRAAQAIGAAVGAAESRTAEAIGGAESRAAQAIRAAESRTAEAIEGAVGAAESRTAEAIEGAVGAAESRTAEAIEGAARAAESRTAEAIGAAVGAAESRTAEAIEGAARAADDRLTAIVNKASANARKDADDLKADLASAAELAQARSDSIQSELLEARRSQDGSIAKLKKESDSKLAKLRTALGEIRDSSDAWRAELEDLRAALESRALEIGKDSEARLDDAMASVKAELPRAIQELEKRLSESSKGIEESVMSEVAALREGWERGKRFSNYGNAPFVRVHNRQLSETDIAKIGKNWMKQLGLSLNPRQLHYIAHQICLAEERCEGRMATTIQAAVLRTLLLLSLRAKKVELLEIGTLFGVASGSLYRAALRAECQVSITIIDPLQGYYDQGLHDEQTGVPVTRKTLASNLAAMGVPKQRCRVIQDLSTSPAALETASDRSYDYALIDGDHSLEGVASDFELYAPLVKPGGVVIIDDYGSKGWPAIKPFVDEHVRTNQDWLWIGAEWETAALRRRRKDPV